MNFDRLDAHLQQHIRSASDIPGVDVIIQQNHKTLFRAQYGDSDLEHRIPMTGNELYSMYSCSKPVTVAGTMRLVERGMLDLDAPASRYLPCLGEVFLSENGVRTAPAHPITVRHLLTMTAGFTYDTGAEPIRALLASRAGRIPTTEMAKAIAASPLAFDPGARFRYSLCHDILGAVVEAVADMPFGEYQKKYIFDPLGMTRTCFSDALPPEETPTPLYSYYREDGVTSRTENTPLTAPYGRYESGGAGLYSTTADYARFAATMAHGGTSAEGYRLLAPETVRMIREEQLSRVALDPTFSCAAGPGYGYGLGVRTLVNKDGGQRSPLGEFGWDGAAGSYVLIDTEHDVSIVYTTNLRFWNVRFGLLHVPVRDLAYEGLGL